MAARLMDYDGTFFRGAKSDADPGQVPLGYYFSGLNVINQGGVISSRPGYRCVIKLPDGNLQGGKFFRPKIGLEQLVAAVDGRVFVAEYPFTSFRQLENLQFSASAKQIFFVQAEQSAERRTSDFESAINVIPSRAVLFMQDGGETAPAYYDGSESGHIRDLAFETPIGGPMAWIGNRLWVANGGSVRASDIANPFSFREEVYLGGVSSFTFEGEVTAMEPTPSLEFPQLLVFTESNCSLLQANVQNRSEWDTLPNFQQEVFRVGCSSQRSVVSHFGQIMWYSPSGVVFFDSAALSKQTARLPIRDNEMAVSKININSDVSLVAGGAFGQYMVLSVPVGDQYNEHTWVLNNASLETISDSSGPSWSGVWTGTRPVQWLYGVIAGAERIYHLSKDKDGSNLLWESFTSDRLDNKCDITHAVEFRGYFGQTGQSQKTVGSDCYFRYAEFAFSAIEGPLDVAAFYAGGMRGAYKPIMSTYVEAARGSLDYRVTVSVEDLIYALKAQSRKLRTQDVGDAVVEETGGCPTEQKDSEDVDENFQIMLVWHGPATLRWVRVFADPKPDSETGDPGVACGREVDISAVRFDGTGARAADLETVLETLSKSDTRYTSNQTAVVNYRGFQAVGVGYAESIVSQAAADRVAQRIAERTAENEIMGQLPNTLSAGIEDE